MKIKQKISVFTVGLAPLLATALVPAVAFATKKHGKTCGGVDTAIISCGKNDAIWSLLIQILQIMTAGVGIVAVGGIVYAAILYASARDQAAQVQKAVGVITNVAIGIVAYALMYAFLQFLIPGGIFN